MKLRSCVQSLGSDFWVRPLHPDFLPRRRRSLPLRLLALLPDGPDDLLCHVSREARDGCYGVNPCLPYGPDGRELREEHLQAFLPHALYFPEPRRKVLPALPSPVGADGKAVGLVPHPHDLFEDR